MKSLIASLLLLVMPCVGIAQDDSPMGFSYREAFEKTKVDGRPLLVFCTAEWCGACKVIWRRDLLPNLKGGFVEGARLAAVYDDDSRTFGSVTKGEHQAFPSVVVYYLEGPKWRRKMFSGGAINPVKRALEFLREAKDLADASFPAR